MTDQPADPRAIPDEPIGVVLRVDAKVCHVAVPESDGTTTTLRLPLRGKLFEERTDEKRPVAVGDRVRISRSTSGDQEGGAIEEVLPRRSRLARRAARAGSEASEREQVLAANIDRVWIVASIQEPPFQPTLVDRLLAGVEREELEATIVLTKLDRDKRHEAGRWIELYRGLGYRAFATSIQEGKETPAELAELRAELRTGTTVLSGLSGVGKSSLLNVLVDGLSLRVGSLSRIRQGKHTTSHTELIPLPVDPEHPEERGYVLDTPGIRNFELYGADPQALPFWFREIAPVARGCSYRNCTHIHEPDCAVRAAVESGEIAPSRYASYVRLQDELSGRGDKHGEDDDERG
jgi:ribosome biogenesis GTPase